MSSVYYLDQSRPAHAAALGDLTSRIRAAVQSQLLQPTSSPQNTTGSSNGTSGSSSGPTDNTGSTGTGSGDTSSGTGSDSGSSPKPSVPTWALALGAVTAVGVGAYFVIRRSKSSARHNPARAVLRSRNPRRRRRHARA